MAVNAYLIKLQKQKAQEISLNRKLMMQFCADAAIMAANDILSEISEFGDRWRYCQHSELHYSKMHFCSFGERRADNGD